MELIEKSGYLKLYSNSDGWQNVWVVLYQDSNLYLYRRQGDNDIKGKVYMKDVAKRFAYGNYTDGLPDRPKPPKGQKYDNVLAIPQGNNSKAKIYWLLCSNQQQTREWMDAISSTLPPSPEKHHPQPQQEHDSQQVVFAPLPMKSGAPPPTKDDAPPPMKGDAPPPYPGPPMPAAEGGGCIGFEHLGGPSPPPAGYQPPPCGTAPYPTQQYANPYPQQGYQQPYFSPPQGYPLQQGYVQQSYVQQGYYQQQPPPPAGYAYPQGQQYGYQQPGYAGQPNVVYVEEQPEKRTFGIFRGKITCSSLNRSGIGNSSKCFGNPSFGSFSKF